MNYNAKKSANKFASMNTNKNSYLTLDEAIAAAIKAGSKLSSANRNRFTKANVSAPFKKLDIQEYQRMVKMKKGISTLNNLRFKLNKPKNKTLPIPAISTGKLSANKFSFLQNKKPVAKPYNAKKNGAMIALSRNKTLSNANKNQAARIANMRKKNANLRKSRNLYSGGKLNERMGKFEIEPYMQPVYNSKPKNIPINMMSLRNRMKKFT